MCVRRLYMQISVALNSSVRLLGDEGRISALVCDLRKVPHSTELAGSLQGHKDTVKLVLQEFDAETKKEGATYDEKQRDTVDLKTVPCLGLRD